MSKLHMHQGRQRSRGFTLIELLVVISIIGMLASIVLVSLNGTRRKATIAVLRQEMLQFRNLLEASYDPNVRATDGKVWGYSGLFSYALDGTGNNTMWLTTTASCDMSYGPGSFANSWNASSAKNANQLCKKIVSIINPSNQLMPVIGGVTYTNPFVLRIGYGSGGVNHLGPPPNGVFGSPDWGAGDKYSIQIYTDGNMVPEVNDIYCVGSSGTSFGLNDNSDQIAPGCYMSP